VLFKDILDLFEVFSGLDQVHLSFLVQLDKSRSFSSEVHQESLSFFASVDCVIIILIFSLEIAVFLVQSVDGIVLRFAVSLKR